MKKIIRIRKDPKRRIDGMTVPKVIKRLVERFQENRDGYCSSAYTEAQARREFIDPLLKALGWEPPPA